MVKINVQRHKITIYITVSYVIRLAPSSVSIGSLESVVHIISDCTLWPFGAAKLR